MVELVFPSIVDLNHMIQVLLILTILIGLN